MKLDRIRCCLLISGLLLWPAISNAAAIDYYTITGMMRDAQGHQLPYRVMPPANYSPNSTTTRYPLILALHGAPGRGTNNTGQIGGGETACWASDTERAARPCFVAAPQCPTDIMWVSVPWDSVPKPIRPATWVTTLALGLVDSIKVKYPIDTTRVYVVGGSMGGVGAVYFPEYRPPLFAASVGVAAGGDTTSSVVRTVMTMGWWLFHGAIDNVIPVAGSREFVKKARALLYADGKDTANIRYTEYPTGAHDIWDQSFYNLPMHQWLFLQKRNASASRVNNDLRPCLQSRDQGLSFVARFFSSPTLVLVPVQGAAPAYTLSGRAVSVGQVRSLVH